MSSYNAETPREERFDNLVRTVRAMDGNGDRELMGSHNVQLELGKKAVRFSLFAPERGMGGGYSPSLLYQKLVKKPEHEGEFWAPTSGIYLRRDELDSSTDEKITELEKILNGLDELFDISAEVGG